MSENGKLPAIVRKLKEPAVIAEMSAAVPQHVDPQQWLRVLQTSIMNDRNLLNAKPASILREAVKLAQVGLTTDAHLGEAYLFADKEGSCQARIDYKGFIKLGRQTGAFTQIYAESICANDPLQRLRAGDAKGIEHELALSNRGDRLGYYAFVRFNDGTQDYEWMEISEIHAVRDRYSQAYKSGKDNPWKPGPSEGEMCKKTVLHRLLKRLPKSPQLERAMSMENEANFPDQPMRDVTPAAAPIDTMDALADKLAANATPEPQESHQEAGDDIMDTDAVEVTEGAPEQPQAQHGQAHEQTGFLLDEIHVDMVKRGPKPTFSDMDTARRAMADRLDELVSDGVAGAIEQLCERNKAVIAQWDQDSQASWASAINMALDDIAERSAA